MAEPRYVELPTGEQMEWPEGVSADDFKAKANKYMMGKSKTPVYTGNFKADFNPPKQEMIAKFPTGTQQEVHNKAEYLPAVGATLGGAMGAGWLSIPGAALGGAAGEAAKQLTNRAIGEPAPETSGKAATDIGITGAEYGALEGGGFALGHGISAMANIIRNARSPLESVAASRLITKTVNPVLKEWPEYMKATQEQAGNIIKYAEEHGIKIKTQRDWAQVARQAAEESDGVFKEKYLKPIENKEVSIGGNYRGRTTDPHRARVSDIYERITNINKELRPNYVQTEQGIVQSKLANEGELLAEKSSLTRTLENEVQRGTGATAENIATIRRRTAQLYSIADHTEAAANVRSSSAGKMAEGQTFATSKPGIIDRAIESVRGGREHIADKNLTKAIKRTRTPSSEIPIPSGATPDVGLAAREATRGERIASRGLIPSHESTMLSTGEKEIASLQSQLRERIAKNEVEKQALSQKTKSIAANRAERVSSRQSISPHQSTIQTTGDKEIAELKNKIAERIAKNNAAKESARLAAEAEAKRKAAIAASHPILGKNPLL